MCLFQSSHLDASLVNLNKAIVLVRKQAKFIINFVVSGVLYKHKSFMLQITTKTIITFVLDQIVNLVSISRLNLFIVVIIDTFNSDGESVVERGTIKSSTAIRRIS